MQIICSHLHKFHVFHLFCSNLSIVKFDLDWISDLWKTLISIQLIMREHFLKKTSFIQMIIYANFIKVFLFRINKRSVIHTVTNSTCSANLRKITLSS